MTGNEGMKVGDKLQCISNEGLMRVGKFHTIQGLTDKDINVNGSPTSWVSRKGFRWRCYRHIPVKQKEE